MTSIKPLARIMRLSRSSSKRVSHRVVRIEFPSIEIENMRMLLEKAGFEVVVVDVDW